jgi:hypothetical protein
VFQEKMLHQALSLDLDCCYNYPTEYYFSNIGIMANKDSCSFTALFCVILGKGRKILTRNIMLMFILQVALAVCVTALGKGIPYVY